MKTQKETLEQALDVVYDALINLNSLEGLSDFPQLYEEDDKIWEALNLLRSAYEGLILAKGDSQHES